MGWCFNRGMSSPDEPAKKPDRLIVIFRGESLENMIATVLIDGAFDSAYRPETLEAGAVMVAGALRRDGQT